MSFLSSYVHYLGCFALILIGLYVVLVKPNLIKVIIGINLIDTGVNLFLIAVGYIRMGTAPIFSADPSPDPLSITTAQRSGRPATGATSERRHSTVISARR